jgi:hypothetical protein
MTFLLTYRVSPGYRVAVPLRRFATLAAGELIIDHAVNEARAAGGEDLALRLEAPDGGVTLYRWF